MLSLNLIKIGLAPKGGPMFFKNYWLWLLLIATTVISLSFLVPDSWQYLAAPALGICMIICSLRAISRNGFKMRHVIGYPIGLVACLVITIIGLAGKNGLITKEVLLLIAFNGAFLTIIFAAPIVLFLLLILSPKSHESI